MTSSPQKILDELHGLTSERADEKLAELTRDAKATGRRKYEAELRLGYILLTLQELRRRFPKANGGRTWEDISQTDFGIGSSQAYQYANLARIDGCLADAGDVPLTHESHARVVVPLLNNLSLASPEQTVLEVVRKAREAATKTGARSMTAKDLEAERAKVDPGFAQALTERTARGTDALRDPDYGESMLVAGPADGEAWTWSSDARDQFAKVPNCDRKTVREMLTFASLSEAVTPEIVAEAAGVAREMRLENGGGSGQPALVGLAVKVVELNRKLLLSDAPSRQILETIDYYPDPEGDTYVPEACDAPSGARPPLLVVIPVGMCPESLLDQYSGSRKDVRAKAEVIVVVSELENHGGPVEDGVVDIAAIRRASQEAGIKKTFHPAGDGIEWARLSGNCSTGCTHACSRKFCYASNAALLYYVQCFVPTIMPARLDAFMNTPRPKLDQFEERMQGWARSIFVGSMTDILNDSFPNWWVQALLNEIAKFPEWRVYLLTKLPTRLGHFKWPPNAVVGVTVTRQKEVRAAAKGLAAVEGSASKWVSAEPLLGEIDPQLLLGAGTTMFAIGAQTRTIWAGEIQPDPVWVSGLMRTIWAAGAYAYPKSNLNWRSHLPSEGYDPYKREPVVDSVPEDPVIRKAVPATGPVSRRLAA